MVAIKKTKPKKIITFIDKKKHQFNGRPNITAIKCA